MICPKCGFDNHLEGALCGSCGRVLFETGPGDKGVPETSWENIPWSAPGGSEAPFKALWFTFVKSILQPSHVFRAIPQSRSIGKPLLYALLTGTIGLIASYFWSLLIPSLLPDESLLNDAMGSGDFSPAYLICTPLLILVQVALAALYVQGALFMTRSRKLPLRETFKVVCFAEGAMLLQIIPGLGMLAAAVLWLIILINGTAALHRVSRFRVILGLSAPLIMCLFIFLFLAILFILLGIAGSSPNDFRFL